MTNGQALIFETSGAAPSRMGGATGAADRPSLLDRLIEERRRGDCTDARRPRPAADAPRAAALPAAPARERTEADEPPAAASPAAPSPASPRAEGARSLDDLVTSTWESLATADVASCFVCGGDLLPRFGAGARPVGGRCRDCGTELS